MKIRIIVTSKLASRLLASLGRGEMHPPPVVPAPGAGRARLLPPEPSYIRRPPPPLSVLPVPIPRAGRELPLPIPRAGRERALPSPLILLGPMAITLLLWRTSPHHISILQLTAAFLLLAFPWCSYIHWQKTGRRGLPLFSGVAAIYWLYFAAPLFWGDRWVPGWRNSTRQVADAAVTQTLLLVVLGIVCLGSGIKSGLGRRMSPKRLPDISWKPLTFVYLFWIAVAGTLMAGFQSLAASGGEGGRQIVSIIQGTASLVAVLILLRRTMDGKASKFEKTLLMAILGVRVLLGVSSGWLGAAAALGLSCAFAYLHKHRRLPIAILACMLPYVLFFQAGKEQFRKTFWYGQYGQVQAGPIEKIEFWVDASLQAWQEAFNDPVGSGVATLLSGSLTRTSLLTQAANVLELTPTVVPYQYGRLYSYLAVSLVPRFLWPEKPSVNEANRFYQVVYGITREQDLDSISIAVGVLTEGYINFGWFGAALVMFLVGVLLDFWNETFLAGSGGALAAGIGIAMIPQLLSVESQLAQYAGGLIQNVLLTVVIFLPITRWRSNVAVKPVRSGALGMAGVRP